MRLLFLTLIIGILLTGCGVIGPNPGSGSQLKKYHEGTDGIDILFLKGNPKYSYEGEQFGTAMFVQNKGADDVTAGNPGRLSVSYDDYYLDLYTVDSDAKGPVDSIVLAGKSDEYPLGEENYFEFIFDAKIFGILRDSIKTKINYNLCYPYNTELVTNTCIDTKIRSQDTSPAACTLKTVTFSGGQGAPVSITKIMPDMVMKKDTVMPVYDITIRNDGDGYILNNTGRNTCSNENIAQDSGTLNRLTVKAKLSTDVVLECMPLEVRMLNGEGTTRCVVPEEQLYKFPRNKRNYNTFLEVVLEYAYVYTTTQEIEIRRINEVEIASMSGCGYYEHYDDVEKKCISLCEFCVKNPANEACNRNREEGFEFTVDFSCACSKDKCLLLSKDNKCIFGYCTGSSYCCSTDECAGKPDNRTCGDHYVCRDQKCGPTTMCDMQLGAQDYACMNIDQCNSTTVKRQLCNGDENNVCCKRLIS